MGRKKIKIINKDEAVFSDGTTIKEQNLEESFYQTINDLLTKGDTDNTSTIGKFVKANLQGLKEAAKNNMTANATFKTFQSLVKDTAQYNSKKTEADSEYQQYQIYTRLLPWQQNVYKDTHKKKALLAGRRCLKYDSKIRLYDDSIIEVQDIKKGDVLYGIDGKPTKVVDVHSGVDDIYRLTDDNGITVECTKDEILIVRDSRTGLVRETIMEDLTEYDSFVQMHGYVYKIIFPDNKHYYIGQHKSRAVDDVYWGSGTYIFRYCKKHNIPIHNNATKDIMMKEAGFKKEILKVCYSKEELDQSEYDFIVLHKDDEYSWNLIEAALSGLIRCGKEIVPLISKDYKEYRKNGGTMLWNDYQKWWHNENRKNR